MKDEINNKEAIRLIKLSLGDHINVIKAFGRNYPSYGNDVDLLRRVAHAANSAVHELELLEAFNSLSEISQQVQENHEASSGS